MGALVGGLVLVTVVSALGAEAWRRWALRRGVLDVPGARSSHERPTPRGGGVGMLIALLAGVGFLLPEGEQRGAIMLTLGVAGAVGLADDVWSMPPFVKLAGQALAALPLAAALPWPQGLSPVVLPEALAFLASWGFLVFTINAWNFMDGSNGIATQATMAVALSLLAGLALGGAIAGGEGAFALIVLAACLGFLPLNWPSARVFMGDCGSHALGAAVAAMILLPAAEPASLVALGAATPFLLDVTGTLVRRAIDGEHLARAHRRHLYQLVIRSGYSHSGVALGYAAWMAASGGAVLGGEAVGVDAAVAFALVIVGNAGIWWLGNRRLESRLRAEGRW